MGMLATGKTKPLNMKNGSRKKKAVIMACCCVAEIVEINSPMPKVLNKNRLVPKNMSETLPLNGIENQKTANRNHAPFQRDHSPSSFFIFIKELPA